VRLLAARPNACQASGAILKTHLASLTTPGQTLTQPLGSGSCFTIAPATAYPVPFAGLRLTPVRCGWMDAKRRGGGGGVPGVGRGKLR
jgi:hypothetical protein